MGMVRHTPIGGGRRISVSLGGMARVTYIKGNLANLVVCNGPAPSPFGSPFSVGPQRRILASSDQGMTLTVVPTITLPPN